MRPNAVKAILADGGIAFGTGVVEFGVTGMPRIAAAAGVDFVLFDTEHNGWTGETLRPLLAASRAVDLVPLVRVESLEYRRIGTPLDLGAMGLMIPMVETGEDAQRIVEYARYPPAGRRGAAFGVAHDDYVPGDRINAIDSANRETLLIALVETARGVENIDAIASVDGIDVIWIGQIDLTMSLGIVGQLDHPRYLAAFQRLIDSANAHGKVLGYTVTSLEEGEAMMERGARCISYGLDVRIYQGALSTAIQGLRSISARRGAPQMAVGAASSQRDP